MEATQAADDGLVAPFRSSLSEDAELTTDLYRLTSYLRGMCGHEWVEGQEFETPSAKGTYTGFVDSRRQPNGIGYLQEVSSSGQDVSTYVGLFRGGLKQGLGMQTQDGGQVYAGEWDGGKKQGPGCMRWADGTCYLGFFLRGTIHGAGTYVRRSDVQGGQRQQEAAARGLKGSVQCTAEGYWTEGVVRGICVDGILEDISEAEEGGGGGSSHGIARLGARCLEPSIDAISRFQSVVMAGGDGASDWSGEFHVMFPGLDDANVVRMCGCVERSRVLASDAEAATMGVVSCFDQVARSVDRGGHEGGLASFAGLLEGMRLGARAQATCSRTMVPGEQVLVQAASSSAAPEEDAVLFLLLDEEWEDVANDAYLRHSLARKIEACVAAALCVHTARLYVSEIVSHGVPMDKASLGVPLLAPKAVLRVLPCPYGVPPDCSEIAQAVVHACSDPSSLLSRKLRVSRCTAPGEAQASAATAAVKAARGNLRQGSSLSNSRGSFTGGNYSNGSLSTSTTPLREPHVSNTPALLPGGGFGSDTPDPPRWWERQGGSVREIRSPSGGGVDATVVIAGRDGVEATMLAELHRRQDRLRGMHKNCEGDGGQETAELQQGTSGHHRHATSDAPLPYC